MKIKLFFLFILTIGFGIYLINSNKIAQSQTTQRTITPTPTTTNDTANQLRININEQNSSGQTGAAIIRSLDNNKTIVVIGLAGTPIDSLEPAHIHRGSCTNLGAIRYPLNPVDNGLSLTVLNVPITQLRSELPLAINAHMSETEIQTNVACTDLTDLRTFNPTTIPQRTQ